MSSQITVCVLLYGDHPVLADRVLRSIYERLDGQLGLVADIRLGLNEISLQTQMVTDWFVQHVAKHYRIPVISYECPHNARKYPLMRRMLLEDPHPPAKYTMWFDDDSYLNGDKDFWTRIEQTMRTKADMVGKLYVQAMRPAQWEWIKQQPWFDAKVGRPPPSKAMNNRPSFRFCTGGWWTIKTEILRRHDWPPRELILIGGDSMLGELCRHQGYTLYDFCPGVRINANEKGEHSKAAPRGESPHPKKRNSVMLGNVTVTDVEKYHQFICLRRVA